MSHRLSISAAVFAAALGLIGAAFGPTVVAYLRFAETRIVSATGLSARHDRRCHDDRDRPCKTVVRLAGRGGARHLPPRCYHRKR